MLYFVIAYIYLLYYLSNRVDKITNVKNKTNENLTKNISYYYKDEICCNINTNYKNISPDNLEVFVSAMINNNVFEI